MAHPAVAEAINRRHLTISPVFSTSNIIAERGDASGGSLAGDYREWVSIR